MGETHYLNSLNDEQSFIKVFLNNYQKENALSNELLAEKLGIQRSVLDEILSGHVFVLPDVISLWCNKFVTNNSIKSRLGGKSTLFNSNGDGTNLRYRIVGDITDEQISYLNLISQYFRRKRGHNYNDEQVAKQDTAFMSLPEEYQNRKPAFFSVWFSLLEDWGYKLEYDGVINDVFKCNLRNIDSHFHKVLSECLIRYYGHHMGSSVKNIIDNVAESDPVGIRYEDRKFWYELVMKRFLIIVALGMKPNTPWDGVYSANGGYLVVKEDGDIVCYHFYDRNQLENYLLNNTAFETPSTSRHNTSKVYRGEDGNVYINLNPQIRFIHSLNNE